MSIASLLIFGSRLVISVADERALKHGGIFKAWGGVVYIYQEKHWGALACWAGEGGCMAEGERMGELVGRREEEEFDGVGGEGYGCLGKREFFERGQDDWEGYFRGRMGYIWCDVNGNAKQGVIITVTYSYRYIGR